MASYPPKFSVLLPVYHGDSAVCFQCVLDSLSDNTILPAELVVVCDGPVNFDLERVVANHAGIRERIQRVELVRLPVNMGLPEALNAGLERCSHEWVFRADADDINMCDRFEKTLQFLAENPDLAVIGGQIIEAESFEADGARQRRVPLSHEKIISAMRRRNPFNHMTVAFRKSSVLAVGGYPDMLGREDYALWILLAASGARFGNLDSVLVKATAGRSLTLRRGGLRYATEEIDLQLLMLRTGISNPVTAAWYGSVRASLFLLPKKIRHQIYKLILREQR